MSEQGLICEWHKLELVLCVNARCIFQVCYALFLWNNSVQFCCAIFGCSLSVKIYKLELVVCVNAHCIFQLCHAQFVWNNLVMMCYIWMSSSYVFLAAFVERCS